MIRKLFILSNFLVCLINANGQLKPLQVGDKVPDIEFSEIVNLNSDRVKISDFKGKLLILDFWTATCATCIAQFPNVSLINQKFKGKAFVLPIGIQHGGDIKRLIEKRKGLPNSISVPTAIWNSKNDTLKKLFPYTGVPHEVWIDAEGHYLAATDHRALTSKNIDKYFETGKLDANMKPIYHYWEKDDYFLINSSERERDSNFYASAFSGFIDTLRDGTPLRPRFSGQTVKFIIINKTFHSIYRSVYEPRLKELSEVGGIKRIVSDNDSLNPIKYVGYKEARGLSNREYEEFQNKNLFSYELIAPKSVKLESLYDRMISDFDFYFDVSSRIELRKVSCLSLQRTSLEDKISAQNPKAPPINAILSDNGKNVIFFSVHTSDLVNYLNVAVNTNKIILDETEFDNKIELTLNKKTNNYSVDEIQRELSKYDLQLKVVERELYLVVIEPKFKR